MGALRHFPGLQPHYFLLHFQHLLEAREIAIPFQFSRGPYFPSLQPAMSFLSQRQFRLATLGKEGLYILVEGWLVFSASPCHIVSALLEDGGAQTPVRQQRVPGQYH